LIITNEKKIRANKYGMDLGLKELMTKKDVSNVHLASER
jgi:hypothetical protein